MNYQVNPNLDLKVTEEYGFKKTRYLYYCIPKIGKEVVFISFDGTIHIDELYANDRRVPKHYKFYNGSAYDLICDMAVSGILVK